MTHASAQYRFGRFVLNPQARELIEDGRLVALAPKVLDALLWLFEHRERAVGRDELGAAIWGKADFTDGQLDQLIWGLRRALGDSGSEKSVIRTVPRFGYRWVAEVEPLLPPVEAEPAPLAPTRVDEEPSPASEGAGSAAAPSATPIPAKPNPAPGRPAPPTALPNEVHRRRFPRLALVAAIVLLLAAAWSLQRWQRSVPDGTTAAPAGVAPATAPLVAVLPVAMDPDSGSQWAWLRLGLMDLLAARLVEGGVHVVPAHNLIALMGGQDGALPSVEKVREATGASIVIAPSIQRTSDGWRLRVTLSGLEGAAREIEVHEKEPTATARHAADRVLVMMNREPVTGRLGEERTGEEAIALRINAAVASQRFDIAQHLLDEVPPELRHAPQVRFMGVHVLLAQDRRAEALAELKALAESGPVAVQDADLHSSILQALGAVLVRSGHPAEALEPLDRAVEVASKTRSAENYGAALQNRAALNVMLGRWPEADADFAQARVAMEMTGDTLGLAELEANEASALINRQRYAEAAALQARTIEHLQRFPAGEALRVAYGNQIAMELDLLNTPAALEVAGKALKNLENPPDERAAAWLAVQVARAEVAAGRYGEAERRLLVLRAKLDPASPPDRQSNAQLLLARIALERSNLAEAARLAASADELRSAPELAAAHFSKSRSAASLLRIRALLALQETAQAKAVLHGFIGWAQESTHPDVLTHLRLAQALVSARADSAEVAQRHFDAALGAADQAAPVSLAEVVVAYGSQLLDAREIGAATRVVGRVARWAEQDFDCALLQARLYHAIGQPEPWRRSLAAARRLAGERDIPPALAVAPAPIVARGIDRSGSAQPLKD